MQTTSLNRNVPNGILRGRVQATMDQYATKPPITRFITKAVSSPRKWAHYNSSKIRRERAPGSNHRPRRPSAESGRRCRSGDVEQVEATGSDGLDWQSGDGPAERFRAPPIAAPLPTWLGALPTIRDADQGGWCQRGDAEAGPNRGRPSRTMPVWPRSAMDCESRAQATSRSSPFGFDRYVGANSVACMVDLPIIGL